MIIIDKFYFKFLIPLLKVVHINLDEKKQKILLEFIKFGIIGLSNTIISYVLYLGTLFALNKGKIFTDFNYLIASFIGFVLSVLWSFYWNNKVVFTVENGKRRGWVKALLKTYISYSFTGLLLNTILLILWVQIFKVSEIIAPIANLVISVPLNFIINKFWTFKTDDKKETRTNNA